MRMLNLSTENKARAQRVLDHATKPENRYKPPCNWVPGDRPEFVARIDTYRCVFTITEFPDGKLFRHLSISVPNRKAQPNVIAACTLATWFGFTGAPMHEGIATRPGIDWQVGLSEEEHCVVLAQLLPEHGTLPLN
jgi:hypothetical protein